MEQKMRRFYSFLFLSCLVILVSCAGQGAASKPAVTPTNILSSLPTSTPTQLTVNQTPLTIAQAWGSGHISQFPVDIGANVFNPGGAYSENTVTDDSQVCGKLTPATLPTNPDQLVNVVQSLALMDLHTGAVTTLQTLPTGYKMVTCAVTGSWITWNEAYGSTYEEYQGHWKIMAMNIQTQEVRQLDQANTTKGEAALLPFPSSSNGNVAWTSYGETLGDTEALLYDFTSGIKTVLAQHASNPLISGSWVSWGDSTQKGIVFKNLVTQQQTILNQHPVTAAFNGTSYVTSNDGYLAITLYSALSPNQISTTTIIDKAINQDFVEYPTVNDRLITWGSNNSLFAFDRKLQRLVQFDGNFIIPQSNHYPPSISSHYMLWEQQANDGSWVMYVIDTNTLP